ncbi:CAP domain-containing protein [Corynebacterium aurimucosum]
MLQAWSYYSDARLVHLWMDSPGHRKNLLDLRTKSVGIGMAVSADGKL